MNGYYTSSWHDFSVYFNPSSGNAVSWDDSLDEPAMTLGAKDAGKWRIEGKDYVVAEGDVMHFRFNV